jgi:hypothetical protein
MASALAVLAGTTSLAASKPPASTPAKSLPDAAERFKERQATTDARDISEQLKLASWAADRNLLEQADSVYRHILETEPDQSEAYFGLLAVAQRRPLSKDSSVLLAADAIVTPAFIQYESKRFVVISNADEAWSRRQLEVLERAHNQFQRFASRLKLRPMPLQNKLVCILFADQEQYRKFAQAHDHVENAWITGYYSPHHDWIVFYDPQRAPEVQQARAQLEHAPREGSSQQIYERQKRRIDEFAAREGAATTIHEATHQLFFHTRIQSPSVRYPLWICEGLATCFETDAPDKSFGPDRGYAPRRNRFRELLRSEKLIPLRELIQIDRVGPGEGEERIDAIYQQSYALVNWMCRFRKDALRLYLCEMRRQPAGVIEAQRHLELFEQAFGDASALERAWLRFEKSQIDAMPGPCPWPD